MKYRLTKAVFYVKIKLREIINCEQPKGATNSPWPAYGEALKHTPYTADNSANVAIFIIHHFLAHVKKGSV